jgi:6-phosphogluconolactonase (cycloisomerase 2 family)
VKRIVHYLSILSIIIGVFACQQIIVPPDDNSDSNTAITADKAALQITFAAGDAATSVTGNLTLPTTGPSGTTIAWSSDNSGIVSATGKVTRPASATTVTLTATISKDGTSQTKAFVLHVLQIPNTDALSVAADKAALQIGYSGNDSASSVTANLTLPTSGSSGSTISWYAEPSGIVSSTGIVMRPSSTTTVNLTATIAKGAASDTKAFSLSVLQMPNTDALSVAADKAALQIGYSGSDSASSVTANLTLPTAGSSGTTIGWASDNAAIVSASGLVTRPTVTTTVNLTATIAKGAASDTKAFSLSVQQMPNTDASSVAADKAALQISYSGGDSSSSVTANLTLPTSGSSGSTINWYAEPSGIVGSTGIVTRPTVTTTVNLTATIAKGTASDTKAFAVSVLLSDAQAVANAKSALEIGYSSGDSASSVTGALTLPTSGLDGASVSWGSDYPAIASASGNVVRPMATTTVTLTATIRKGTSSATKPFPVTVVISDAGVVAADKAALQIGFGSGDSALKVTQNLSLPTAGAGGSSIVWSAAPAGMVSATGTVTRPTYTTAVTATATLSMGSASDAKDFKLYVIGSATQLGFVYAAGNKIYAYRINTDGSLAAVPGSPFGSGTFNDVAVAPSNSYLYALGGGGLVSYAVNPDGSLATIYGSPSTVYDGANSISISPSSDYLYITDAGSSVSAVAAYSIGSSGLPTPMGSPVSTSPEGNPTASVVSPDGSYLYVADSNGIPGTAKVGSYSIGADGSLSLIATILGDQGNYGNRIAITPSGNHVYMTNSDTISEYSKNADGSLTSLGAAISAHPSGSPTETGAIAISPSGSFLYTVQGWSGEAVSCFRIYADGSLSAPTRYSVSSQSVPYDVSIALDASSHFLYAPSYNENNLYAFTVDQATGALAPVASAATIGAAAPRAVAATH